MAGSLSYGGNIPLDVEKIVDRLEQHESFIDVVERMRSGMPFPHNLFEWYGPPGIGKSTLITLLESECKQRGIPYLSINFDVESKGNKEAYFKDPILLVERIVEYLAQCNVDTTQILENIQAYRKVLAPPDGISLAYARMTERERTYTEQEWLVKMRNVINSILEGIEILTSDDGQGHIRPFVLFFDGLENVHELFADWLEEFLVKPLIQTKHCIVIWTARHPWKWKRPEIRWDRKSEELRAFNQEEVKAQLSTSPRFKSENNLVEQLFQNVFSMTGGHPFAGTVVMDQIGGWRDINVSVLKKREQELYREINKHVIREYAFKGLPVEQRTALELCSMVRLIDVTTLQHVLQECAGGEFNNWQRKDFDRLLFDLRKTYLLKWGNSGWTLNPSLRHLLRSYYLTCAVETFRKVNQAALNVYQEWLARPVDNRKLFIIEELYHCISLQQIDVEEKDINLVLEKRLDQYPDQVKEDSESWRYTLEQIDGEIEHDEEFSRLMNEQSIQQLTGIIKKRISEMN